jgi:lambda repressor-like predicted transcriptional regulator
MDVSAAISDLLLREAITQKELAKRAGVSQSTVDRVLDRRPRRQGKAYRKLIIYMQKHAPEIPPEAAHALGSVWDGSRAHDRALASLVRASEELWPSLRGG